MNQGRIWCVVHPTVGLPLLLGSVAATSLIVHACVLTHTPWFSSYWSGSWRNKVSMNETTSPALADVTQGQPAYAISIAPVAGIPGKTETSFVVTVTPNPAAKPSATATLSSPPKVSGPLALAAPSAK
jgi:light-harvesting protein B-800-850 alpha chain